MFSIAEFSMIHLNALTFNQILYIIFIISIFVLSINLLLKAHTFISYKNIVISGVLLVYVIQLCILVYSRLLDILHLLLQKLCYFNNK